MARRRVEGFTLIELMVVATIIGLSIIAFTPSFVLSMADRRASGALSEVIRLGRQARADTIGTGRAHLVMIQPGGGIRGSGFVQVLRGTNGHCDLQRWATFAAACTTVASDPRICPNQIDLDSDRWYRAPLQVRLRTVRLGREQQADLISALQGAENSLYLICHEPSGATLWSPGPLADPVPNFSELNAGQMDGGAALFSVGLVNEDTGLAQGMPRVFAFPLGTTPRRLR